MSLSDTATQSQVGQQGKHWVSYTCSYVPMQSLKSEGGLEPIPLSLLLSAMSKALWIFINPKASITGKHWKLPSAWLALFFFWWKSSQSCVTVSFRKQTNTFPWFYLTFFLILSLYLGAASFSSFPFKQAASEKHSSSVALTKCERGFTYLYLTDPSSLFKSQVRNNIFLSC